MNQTRRQQISETVRKTFAQANLDYDDVQAQIVPLNKLICETSELLVAELSNGTILSTRNAVKFLEREIGFEMPDLDVDDKKLSGFLYVTQNKKQLRGCILTDKGEPSVRRRFSAAHELGHYLLHFLPLIENTETENLFLTESLMFDEENNNKAEIEIARDFDFKQIGVEDKFQMELEADFFAAELLMPSKACLKAAQVLQWHPGKNKRALIDNLATLFFVSFEAMKRRLEDLEVFQREV